MKKILSVTLVALLVLALLSGCNPTSSTTPSSGTPSSSTPGSSTPSPSAPEITEPVTIEIWHLWGEDMEETRSHWRMTKWAEEFNAANEFITVNVYGGKSVDGTLTAIASESVPDIFMNQWPNTSTWADKGALLDLTDYVNNDAEFDYEDFLPGARGCGEYKGSVYSIPFGGGSSFIFYRKDLLGEIGFPDGPKTFEDMITIAKELTTTDSKGNITRAGYIPMYPWLDNVLWPVAGGADWLDVASNKVTFNTPEMRAAYQWQVDINNEFGYDKLIAFKDGLGGGESHPLLTGELAMMFRGEGIINDLVKYGENVDWAMCAIPYPSSDPSLAGANFLTTNVWNINAKTKNPDVAWYVLSQLAGKDFMSEMANGEHNNGAMMMRISSLDAIQSMDLDESYKKAAVLLKDPSIRAFPMSAYVNEYLGVINTQMMEALQGNISVEEACANVEAEVQPMADANPMN